MVKTQSVLASVAAFGLTFAQPAFAQSTRAGDALPDPVAAASLDLSRATAPLDEASELNRRNRRVALLLFFLLVAGGLIAIGGGDSSTDSPG